MVKVNKNYWLMDQQKDNKRLTLTLNRNRMNYKNSYRKKVKNNKINYY